MKTEDLVREFVRTHENKPDKSKRAGIQKPVRSDTPVTLKR